MSISPETIQELAKQIGDLTSQAAASPYGELIWWILLFQHIIEPLLSGVMCYGVIGVILLLCYRVFRKEFPQC